MSKAFPIARTHEEAAEQERVRNAEMYADWERQREQIAAMARVGVQQEQIIRDLQSKVAMLEEVLSAAGITVERMEGGGVKWSRSPATEGRS